VAIIALFSDDVLVDKLVLKGGNALRLVYGLGSRSSMDIDVSIDEDFEDLDDVKKRLLRALTSRFELAGYVVFDFTFGPRPSNQAAEDRWGGYQLIFKLIEKQKHSELEGNLEKIRRNSMVIGPAEERKFTVDMSKYEFVGKKQEVEWEGFTINVYTPAMIAIEKLRAICQQMKDYPLRKHHQPRARDFYDIHLIITEGKLDFASAELAELVRPVFAAKEVPVSSLERIEEEREFHRVDWPRVQATVSGVLEPFDFYFDFVLEQVRVLKTSGIV